MESLEMGRDFSFVVLCWIVCAACDSEIRLTLILDILSGVSSTCIYDVVFSASKNTAVFSRSTPALSIFVYGSTVPLTNSKISWSILPVYSWSVSTRYASSMNFSDCFTNSLSVSLLSTSLSFWAILITFSSSDSWWANLTSLFFYRKTHANTTITPTMAVATPAIILMTWS